MITTRKKIAIGAIWLVGLTGCNLWDQNTGDGNATITLAWPTQSNERAKPGEAAKEALPAEVSTIGIVIQDTAGRNLAAGELRREGPALSMSIPTGLAVGLTAEARAGSEVLYRGKSSLGVLSVGEARSVRIPLEGIVALDLVAPQTAFGAGGDTGKLSVQVQGLQNNAIKWFVNGIEGGNQSVGTIDSAGIYSPPSILPATKQIITARAEPLAAPSFGREVSLTLVNGNVSVKQNAVSISGNELDPDPTNNSVVETTTIVDAP